MKKVNFIRHVTTAFEKMDSEERVDAFHISLYLALFRHWNSVFFENPVLVSREELKIIARIGSNTTYYRCMRDLEKFGLIRYERSRIPSEKSRVIMNSVSDHVSVPHDGHINKTNTNNKKNKTIKHKHKEKKIVDNLIQIKSDEGTQEIKPNGLVAEPEKGDIPPARSHLEIYFQQKGASVLEAEKFFNHFESNGWLVGGRAVMKDWKAAARNWILNIKKFSGPEKKGPQAAKLRSGNLHAKTGKNYGEPF